MANKTKKIGQVYTPNYIVKIILDMSGYKGKQLLCKHAIDNSCGDGAFLTEMLNRYCSESKKQKIDVQQTKKELETYIHGIELDEVEWKKCIGNLNQVAANYGITDVNWDVICANTLSVDKYDGKMDYVLGNPPYVRVHNLGDSFEQTKSFSFSQQGMTDLFITFFEIGIKMLNETGVLGYITPSSYFNSVAATYMRKYLVDNDLLDKVVDLKHFQAFTATTYTAITILDKSQKNGHVKYYTFDDNELKPKFCEELLICDYYQNSNFYFGNKRQLNTLKKILNNIGKSHIQVKNGFATLCDPVFIHDFDFKSKYIIPVIKASTGERKKIFYPYDKNARLISLEEIKKDENMYSYLIEHVDDLTNRSLEDLEDGHWHAFGRSQAIVDTYTDKLGINSLLRTIDDWKFSDAPPGVGIYSGLYIIAQDICIDDIIEALKSDEFIEYISILGKYKSGGYYTFSTKDLKAYLDYKLAYIGGIPDDYE